MHQDPNSLLEENQLTDKALFTQIWTSPRKIFRLINDLQYEKHFYLLMFFAGVARSFERSSLKNAGDNLDILSIVGLSVIAGGLFGWFSFYLYAALISWTGKWLNAQGDREAILRILAYAMLPSVIGLLFLIPQIGVYGNEIFKENGDITSAGLMPNLVVYFSMFMEIALGGYTIVLCVIGVSEVQKLSVGKTIVNLVLPVLVIGIPVIVLAVLFNLGN